MVPRRFARKNSGSILDKRKIPSCVLYIVLGVVDLVHFCFNSKNPSIGIDSHKQHASKLAEASLRRGIFFLF